MAWEWVDNNNRYGGRGNERGREGGRYRDGGSDGGRRDLWLIGREVGKESREEERENEKERKCVVISCNLLVSIKTF